MTIGIFNFQPTVVVLLIPCVNSSSYAHTAHSAQENDEDWNDLDSEDEVPGGITYSTHKYIVLL